MHNRKTFIKVQSNVLSKNRNQLFILQLFLFLTLLLVYHNAKDNKLWLIVLIGRFIELFKTTLESTHQPDSLINEIKKNREFFVNHPERLVNIRSSTPNTLCLTTYCYSSNVNDQCSNGIDKNLKIAQTKFALGTNIIYPQLQKFMSLNKKLKNKQVYVIYKSSMGRNVDLPTAPDLYPSWMTGPYIDKATDMASKARVIEIFGIPGYIAGDLIANVLDLSPNNSFILKLAYTALNWCLSQRESYLLKHQNYELNLRGFSYFYNHYFSFPPTCIGQQLTREIRFSGINKNLYNAYSYISNAEYGLVQLHKNPATPKDIKKLIQSYPFLIWHDLSKRNMKNHISTATSLSISNKFS